jgi:excisionase family DNA binding protein
MNDVSFFSAKVPLSRNFDMLSHFLKEKAKMSNTLDDLLTPREVASYLKVPLSWVYARTCTGELPVRKLGGHIRIPASLLKSWVEAQGQEHQAAA